MSQKKYISLNKLSVFLENLSNKFANLVHTHNLSDIVDYTVDSELLPDSTNPVQNKVIDAEFNAIANAMGALESAIDDKADSVHTHVISEVDNLQTTLDTLQENIDSIPQPDWSQNDENAEDFIKNRTHYDSITVLAECKYFDNEDYYRISEFTWEKDKVYIVICDGVKYEISSNGNIFSFVGGSVIYWGSAPNNITSDLPFSIFTRSSSLPVTDRLECYFYDGESPASHSLQIIDEEIHQLDEKYIPSSIARVDDVEAAIAESSSDYFATLTNKYVAGTGFVLECDTDFETLWQYHEEGRDVFLCHTSGGQIQRIRAEFHNLYDSDVIKRYIQGKSFNAASRDMFIYELAEDAGNNYFTSTQMQLINITQVKQETGTNTSFPMSQNAVTEALATNLTEAKSYADTAIGDLDSEKLDILDAAFVESKSDNYFSHRTEIYDGTVGSYAYKLEDVYNEMPFACYYYNFEVPITTNDFDRWYWQIKYKYNGTYRVSKVRSEIDASSLLKLITDDNGGYADALVGFYNKKTYTDADTLSDSNYCCMEFIVQSFDSMTGNALLTEEEFTAIKEAIENAEIRLYICKNNVLTLNNTAEYTPTEDYHPSTKKYVDDSITSIPEQVQANWNENDETSVSFVKNRTHYAATIVKMEDLTDSTIVNGWCYHELSSGVLSQIRNSSSNDLMLRIYWNTGNSFENERITPVVEFNDNYMVASNSYGEYPRSHNSVLIVFSDATEIAIDSSTTITLDKGLYLPYDEEYREYVAGFMAQEVTYKLPEQYIPDTIARASDIVQSNWNQNDVNAKDYIKNRPFYENITTLLAETDIVIDNNITSIGKAIPFVVGCFYAIILDGTKYEAQAVTSDYGISVQLDINNSSLSINYEGNITAEPVNYGDHTIQIISLSDYEIKQLDEKYIPETIARVPTEEDALVLVAEMGLVSPATADDGSIYTDENGVVYTL